MQIEHARELKQLALRRATTDDWGRPLVRGGELRSLMFHRLARGIEPRSQLSIGIAPNGTGTDYRLAIRVRGPGPSTTRATDILTDLARGEVDVRVVGA